MIKSELAATIASKLTHLPEHKIAQAVNHILDKMIQKSVEGVRIEIRGFGSFSIHTHKPRQAHNPKTGEKIITPTQYALHFKPGKELRERVDASRNSHPIED